jgi:D-arabinose 1-dehydrogenase-like Zn-dependent alcohol dehydrogenase
MTMPAVVFTADRTIDFQERPRPSLRPDQVIVEVELCGICGSDLHAVSVDVAIECSGKPLADTLSAFDDLQAGRIMKALIAPNW